MLLLPNIPYSKSLREWVGWVNDIAGEAGDPALAANCRDDCWVGANLGFLKYFAGKKRPDHTFVAEVIAFV